MKYYKDTLDDVNKISNNLSTRLVKMGQVQRTVAHTSYSMTKTNYTTKTYKELLVSSYS